MDQHISLFYIPLIYFAPFLYVSIMSNSVRYIHTQAQAQAELQRLREVCRASAAAKKRRIEVDPDYARQLQANATERQQKHVDRMTTARKVRRQQEKVDYIREREHMIEKVQQRYYFRRFLSLISFSITELDAQFTDLQVKEQQ